jgi:Tol biopolymer transport system component
MYVDGSTVVRLTSDPDWDTQPVLSMDKSKVAFTSYRNGANNGDIYTVHSDGSTETRLTSTTDDDEYPAFSPDGTKIAFTRYAPGNDAGDLYIMNADGTNVVKVTDTVDGEYAASFSVDGTRLFYAVDNKVGSLQGIVSCNLDGSDQKIVDATASTWKTCGWVY